MGPATVLTLEPASSLSVSRGGCSHWPQTGHIFNRNHSLECCKNPIAISNTLEELREGFLEARTLHPGRSLAESSPFLYDQVLNYESLGSLAAWGLSLVSLQVRFGGMGGYHRGGRVVGYLGLGRGTLVTFPETLGPGISPCGWGIPFSLFLRF